MDKLELYALSNNNIYAIVISAYNIGEPVPVVNYDAVGAEITRMRLNPIPSGVQDGRFIPLQVPRFNPVRGVSGSLTSPVPDLDYTDHGESFINDQEKIEGL